MNARRRPRASLLPKILAALVVSLLIASAATLLLENRLTRDQLQGQAQALLRNELNVLRNAVADRQASTVTGIGNATAGLALLDATDPARRGELVGGLGRVNRDLGLDVLTALTVDGVPTASVGLPIVPPPPSAMDELAPGSGRLVPTVDGRYAQVVIVPLGAVEDRILLVAGRLFDDAAAYRLRGLVGNDVLLVADGDVVGSTLRQPTSTPPGSSTAGGLPEGPQVVDIDGTRTFVQYESIMASATVSPLQGTAAWSAQGAVGAAIPDPIATLDRTLARNRAAGIALLSLLALGLAWLIFRLLTRPLLRLADTAQRIAGGDLDVGFTAHTGDEIGVLADALETMRRAQQEQLRLIRRQTRALQATSTRIVGAQDAERRRLARDLHDGIQQQLVMLRMRAGFARTTLAAAPDRLDEVATDLAAEIDAIIERLRETSQDIYPSILADRGLRGALYSLAGRCPVPLTVHCEPDPLPRLGTLVEASAYFVASEAVANALKHAAAASLSVTAALDDGTLELRVADDGRGFDGALEERGIANMRDRTAALGGVLAIRPRPSGGTVVTARFPMTPPNGSPRSALQEEQHGGNAPVHLEVLRQPQLAEDRVDVLLDRPVGDEQRSRDRDVALP